MLGLQNNQVVCYSAELSRVTERRDIFSEETRVGPRGRGDKRPRERVHVGEENARVREKREKRERGERKKRERLTNLRVKVSNLRESECVCVCVCVCAGEREIKRARKRQRDKRDESRESRRESRDNERREVEKQSDNQPDSALRLGFGVEENRVSSRNSRSQGCGKCPLWREEEKKNLPAGRPSPHLVLSRSCALPPGAARHK